MVRDKYRDKEHFLSLIRTKVESHEKRIEKLECGQIAEERILPVKQAMVTNLIQKTVAEYSSGICLKDLSKDFETIIRLMEESWLGGKKKLIGPKNTVMDQYIVDSYTQMLRLLSIGYLLREDEDFFQRLGKIIKEDNVVDLVFEYILSTKLNSWTLREESSSYAFKLYRRLKMVIEQSDNKVAEKSLKIFLEKDWINEQKKAQLLTEPEVDWYYGRWSFESAVITCIKGLDDSSYRDNPYYPKDLVDYYRQNSNE